MRRLSLPLLRWLIFTLLFGVPSLLLLTMLPGPTVMEFADQGSTSPRAAPRGSSPQRGHESEAAGSTKDPVSHGHNTFPGEPSFSLSLSELQELTRIAEKHLTSTNGAEDSAEVVALRSLQRALSTMAPEASDDSSGPDEKHTAASLRSVAMIPSLLSPQLLSSVRAVERLTRRIKQLLLIREENIVKDADGTKYDYRDVLPFSLLDPEVEQRALLRQSEDDEKLTQATYEHAVRSTTYWSPFHAVRRGKGLEFSIFVSLVSFRDPFCAVTVDEVYRKASWPIGVFMGIVEQHANAQTVMRESERMNRKTAASSKASEKAKRSSGQSPSASRDENAELEGQLFNASLDDLDRVYDGTCIPPSLMSKACQHSLDFCPLDNIHLRQFAPTRTRGFAYARYLSTLMYRGETYVMFLGGATHSLTAARMFNIIVRGTASTTRGGGGGAKPATKVLPDFFSPLASSSMYHLASNWDRKLILLHRQRIYAQAAPSSGAPHTKVVLSSQPINAVPLAIKCATGALGALKSIWRAEMRDEPTGHHVLGHHNATLQQLEQQYGADGAGADEQVATVFQDSKYQLVVSYPVTGNGTGNMEIDRVLDYDRYSTPGGFNVTRFHRRIRSLLQDRMPARPGASPFTPSSPSTPPKTQNASSPVHYLKPFRFLGYPDLAALLGVALETTPSCTHALDSYEYVPLACEAKFSPDFAATPTAKEKPVSRSPFPQPQVTMTKRQSDCLGDRTYLTPLYPVHPAPAPAKPNVTRNPSASAPPPGRQPWVSMEFLFGFADLLLDVPLDPHLEFAFLNDETSRGPRRGARAARHGASDMEVPVYDSHKEDFLYSARLFTSGYDVYPVTEPVLFHYSLAPNTNSHAPPNIENASIELPEAAPASEAVKAFSRWEKTAQLAERRARNILGIEAAADEPTLSKKDQQAVERDLDVYGLGKERTLEAFYTFAGVDMKRREGGHGTWKCG